MQPTEEYDLGSGSTPEPQPVNRPFFHQIESEASLDSSGQSDGNDSEDRERLTPRASGSNGIGHRRQPSRRVFDEHGLARPSGIPKLAATVARSPTFRTVSRTLRKASVRVVNIMGSDQDQGMVRLDDYENEEEEEDDVDTKVADEEDGQAPKLTTRLPLRPDPMPPEGRLRGRTLGLLGRQSWTRRAMDGVLRHP